MQRRSAEFAQRGGSVTLTESFTESCAVLFFDEGGEKDTPGSSLPCNHQWDMYIWIYIICLYVHFFLNHIHRIRLFFVE